MSTYNSQTGKLSPQSLLQQRYIIVGQAGRGGMGAVYQATDTRLAHRRVAVKEMSQGHLSKEELQAANARFEQEASMLGALSHPNLLRIYDAFSENGRSYLVMDFIEGKTLHQLLREAQGQPLPIAQVLTYARQLCDVLFYLHQHNPPIIFRDVKPTNIMVTENGQVFLIDFGIARFFKEGQQQDTTLLGSPGYAPPEQHGMAQTNPRSDIYGLGATLHFCLTGRDPYHALPLFSFPPVRQSNPLVPVELDQLIQRMLAHDERTRPATALEVQQTLITISQQAAEHTSALAPSMPAPTTYTSYVASPNTTPPLQAPGDSSMPIGTYPTIAVPPARPMTVPHLQMSRPAQAATLWSTGFLSLFIGILLVTLISGISALSAFFISDQSGQINYGWAIIVETGLSFLLLLTAIAATLLIRNPTSRVVSTITGIAALICGLALLMLGSKDVQDALSGIVSIRNYLNILDWLTIIGLGAATLSTFGWFLRPSLRSHLPMALLLFGGAAVCTILQPFFPLLSHASGDALLLLPRHILLLAGLIALIQGVLLAMRIEQVEG